MAFWETQVNSVLGTSVGTLLAIKPKRTFASFSGFVSITESHSTATEATSYSIEDGTQGTDHIIRKPDALSWELAFMPESDPETMFRKLRELQMSGEPFDADTGLKRYTNLVILSLACTQDAHSGRICRVNISMQEIIITSAVTTILPPRAKQAAPQLTASTSKNGMKSLEEAKPTNSALENIWQAYKRGTS